jgi:hypothetical protein
MKNTWQILLLKILIACLIVFAAYDYINIKKSLKTKSVTITSLLSENQSYRTKNGEIALQNNLLKVTRKELKESNNQLIAEIENLKIKIKNVQTINSTATQTNIEIKTEIRDSIIYEKSIDTIYVNQVKTFTYTDNWSKITGLIEIDSISLNYSTHDTIINVLSKGNRKKWWKVWEKRPIIQTVTNKNPHSKITYSKHLEID